MYLGEALFAADIPAWFVRVVSFVFGALWGSFFNVAIYRWPRGMSVVTPPSHCPACGAPVRWYLNVPVFGYLWLKGRARCCGAPMTPRYVWVELITAVLCLAVAERYFVRAPLDTAAWKALLDTVLYFAFVGGLVIATFVDLEWMEIPDEVSLPGAALGLATVGLRTGPEPVSAAVGAGLGFLVVYLLFVVMYELLRGRRGMGEGDAKLLLMIGAFLGWESILFCLAAGSAQGLVAAGVAKVFGVPLVPVRPDEIDEASDNPSPVPVDTAHQAPEVVARTDAPGAPSQPPAASATPGEGSHPDGGALTETSPPASAAEQAAAEEEDEHAGPPMMVFGPMLALAALEYLFFGDRITAWLFGQ